MQLELDDRLWAMACSGDKAAFATLFNRHKDRVFRHAARLLTTDADADEVAGAAFIELWRKREAVSVVNGSMLPWLLVTATNLSRNLVRGSARYGAATRRAHQDDLAHNPEDVALDRLAAARGESPLMQSMRRLPDIDQELLSLTVLEGLPVADAASLLGLSYANARSRISRAKARLRNAPELRTREAPQGGMS